MNKKPTMPRDTNMLAKAVVDMAIGDKPKIKDTRNKSAVSLGALGGNATAKKMTKEQRIERAKKAGSKKC